MFDEDWFTGKGSSKGWTSRTISSLRKAQEDSAALTQMKAQQAADEQKKKEDSKNIFQKAGDFVGGVVTGIKDDAVNAYTGIKDVIEGSTSANAQLRDTEEYRKKQKVLMDKLYSITGDKTDEKTWSDPKVKDLQNQLNKLALENGQGGGLTDEQKKAAGADQKKIDEWNKTNQERQKQMDESQKVDAKKTAFAAGSTFLNATIVYGAAEAGAKAVGTQVVKGMTKSTVEQMVKTGGMLNTCKSNGSRPSGADEWRTGE